MLNQKTSITGLAALVIALAGGDAFAGRGGSAKQIRSAVASGSPDAIIAELERTEGLICSDCVDAVTALVDHNNYAVREAAGWWFSKRPSLAKMMTSQMVDDLALTTDSIKIRNAADFLGSARAFESLAPLATAFAKQGVSGEAKVAIVRAAGVLGDKTSNAILTAGMKDSDASVRREAVIHWRDIREQKDAAPLVGLLSDADAIVRSEAATVVGAFRQVSARQALEALVTSDADAIVRRNAAWALGKIGDRASYNALSAAANDSSGLVRGVAKAALASLK